MSEEKVDYETKEIIEPWLADQYIETVKANVEEIKKLKQIAQDRKTEIDRLFKEKEEKLLNENRYALSVLTEFAKAQEDLRSLKTQYKYDSLSGNIVIKKPQTKIISPKEKDRVEIGKKFPDYVSKKVVEKLNYAELKKRLMVQNDKVFDGETGEDVSHLFKIEKTEEETSVE